jgi:hypothetical protein
MTLSAENNAAAVTASLILNARVDQSVGVNDQIGRLELREATCTHMPPEVDVEAFESEINSHRAMEIFVALDHVRGRPNAVCHGKVEDGWPKPGVLVRRLGGDVRFDVTVVSGDNYTRETHSMPESCFSTFASALLELLRDKS